MDTGDEGGGSKLVELVMHPQLCAEVLQCLDPNPMIPLDDDEIERLEALREKKVDAVHQWNRDMTRTSTNPKFKARKERKQPGPVPTTKLSQIPGGLLELRAVSTTIKDQVEGFIVEVVTEAMFLWQAEKKVPYYNEGLVKPFCRLCLFLPKPPPDDEEEPWELVPGAVIAEDQEKLKEKRETLNKLCAKSCAGGAARLCALAANSKGPPKTRETIPVPPLPPPCPTPPPAAEVEKEDRKEVDLLLEEKQPAASDFILARFRDEMERRFTPEVKYIGSTGYFGKDSFKRWKKLKNDSNFLPQIPPFPDVLDLLTSDRVPQLLSLNLQAHNLSSEEHFERFISEENRPLLHCIQYLSFQPTQDAKKRYQGRAHKTIDVKRYTPGYTVPEGNLVRFFRAFSGGVTNQLVLGDVFKRKINTVLRSLTESGFSKQLTHVCLIHSFHDDEEPGDGEVEDALRRFAAQSGQLQELTIYAGHYKKEPTFDPTFLQIAATCSNLTRVHLMCWTLIGVEAIVKSVGPQLELIDGNFLWGTDLEEAITAAQLVANGCPVLEKCFTVETYSSSHIDDAAKQKELSQAYFDTIELLVAKCPKLETLKWKAHDLDQFEEIVSKAGSRLKSVSVEFNLYSPTAMDSKRFADIVYTHCRNTVETLEWGCFRESISYSYVRGTGDPKPIFFTDEVLVTLIKRCIGASSTMTTTAGGETQDAGSGGGTFSKMEHFTSLSVPGISVEAMCAFVTAGCPALETVHIARPYLFLQKEETGEDRARKGVSIDSRHPEIIGRRGQRKIVPTGQSNSALRTIIFPKAEDLEDALEDSLGREKKKKKKTDADTIPTIVDGVDLVKHVKELTQHAKAGGW